MEHPPAAQYGRDAARKDGHPDRAIESVDLSGSEHLTITYRRITGGSGNAGPTATAGGLVFIGATNDARFRAFDSANGRELWSVQLPDPVNANPMTYLGSNGKQYVAVVVNDTLRAFALP